MRDIRYLTAAEVQGLYTLLGVRAELLDEAKLESATLRPENLAHYGRADLYQQAASLISGILLAHAYGDGNKRLALLAGDTFLRVNGVIVRAEKTEFARQVQAILTRTDTLDSATERLVTWLRAHGSTT